MAATIAGTPRSLGLQAGELVEIRAPAEILATVDERGMLDGLPFMPEMLRFCGQRYRVRARADKTCDTIQSTESRRMRDAVHLADLRCDGAAHAACQAACLLFWKEAWLKRAEAGAADAPAVPTGDLERAADRLAPTVFRPESALEHPTYRCQTTELVRATTPLRWWDPRQYARELLSGNITLGKWARVTAVAAYNVFQRRFKRRLYPHVEGRCEGGTPTAKLGLQVGELVRVRSAEEIYATLDKRWRNRGLSFGREQVLYCGKVGVVKARVERILDEKSGRLVHLPTPSIMVEGMVCGGCHSPRRLFCPRAIYMFWREIWLERVEAPTAAEPPSPRASRHPDLPVVAGV